MPRDPLVEEGMRDLVRVIGALAEVDERYLRANRDAPIVRCPRPMSFDLHSQDEWCERSVDPVFSETLHDVGTVLRVGRASSSDLVAWRCAELRVEGRSANVVLRVVPIEAARVFNVGVRYEDEDGAIREEWF